MVGNKDFDFKLYGTTLILILAVSLLFNFYILHDNIKGPSSSDARLERIEYVANYSIYFHHSPQYGVNENMTLADARSLYLSPQWRTYKDFGVVTMLGYICDGDNEQTVKHMLR